MGKSVKKVYLPSGLLVAMYNLYGGDGSGNEILSMHDIQIVCSYLEFYFNYTKPNAKKYIYRFYTLPHFYSGNRNALQDIKIKKEDRKIQNKYAVKVSDDKSAGDKGQLFLASMALMKEKLRTLKHQQTASSVEIDPTLSGIAGVPFTPYECALYLEAQDFRMRELYGKHRYDGSLLFPDGACVDLSTFFTLKANSSFAVLPDSEFEERNQEMRKFLKAFFESDGYKLLAEDKTDNFAPELNTFIHCFTQALRAYKRNGLSKLNQKYKQRIEEARANSVDIEIVGE